MNSWEQRHISWNKRVRGHVTVPTHIKGGVLDSILEAKNGYQVLGLKIEHETHEEEGYESPRDQLNFDHIPVYSKCVYVYLIYLVYKRS